MDFNAMSTNSGATVIGGWGSLESFMPQLPGSVDHEHPNASDLHVHPDRTIEPGISYSRKLCPDSSCDTDREASVQALKTFTSNKPADIRVQLQSHFDKFEPTHPGIRRVQGLRGGKVRWVFDCKPKDHSTAEGGVSISAELGSTHL